MRQRTILRALVFIIALMFSLALPISARWDSHDTSVAKAPNARLRTE